MGNAASRLDPRLARWPSEDVKFFKAKYEQENQCLDQQKNKKTLFLILLSQIIFIFLNFDAILGQ